MAKGNVAKDYITKTILDTFGDQVAGIQDKKIYIWADDGGERVQIAISMTMPKTFIGETSAFDSAISSGGAPLGTNSPIPTEMSAEDKAKVAELMAKLGIS